MGIIEQPQPDSVVSAGSATLSSGSATVSYPALTATQKVIITAKGGGLLTNLGSMRVVQTPGTGFTISSTNALDNNVVDYMIVQP